ncbi:MAG: type II secretion system protein GspG [Alphaproteobacteria bacterium]|nr:type II secretion system protein GspG [Alphaproteobacteria bacterium]
MRRLLSRSLARSGPAWSRHPVSRIAVVAAASALLAVCAGQAAALSAPDTRAAQVRADLVELSRELERYRVCHGDWPSSLDAVVDETPLDPWGRPYVLAPPAGARSAPDVLALGADGWPGGEGAAQDVWASELPARPGGVEPGC